MEEAPGAHVSPRSHKDLHISSHADLSNPALSTIVDMLDAHYPPVTGGVGHDHGPDGLSQAQDNSEDHDLIGSIHGEEDGVDLENSDEQTSSKAQEESAEDEDIELISDVELQNVQHSCLSSLTKDEPFYGPPNFDTSLRNAGCHQGLIMRFKGRQYRNLMTLWQLLPNELRDLVLRYIFCDTEVLITAQESPTRCVSLGGLTRSTSRVEDWEKKIYARITELLPWLIQESIHSEAWAKIVHIYFDNFFIFHDLKVMRDFLITLGPLRAHLRRIKLIGKFTVIEAKDTFKLLVQCPRLEEFCLTAGLLRHIYPRTPTRMQLWGNLLQTVVTHGYPLICQNSRGMGVLTLDDGDSRVRGCERACFTRTQFDLVNHPALTAAQIAQVWTDARNFYQNLALKGAALGLIQGGRPRQQQARQPGCEEKIIDCMIKPWYDVHAWRNSCGHLSPPVLVNESVHAKQMLVAELDALMDEGPYQVRHDSARVAIHVGADHNGDLGKARMFRMKETPPEASIGSPPATKHKVFDHMSCMRRFFRDCCEEQHYTGTEFPLPAAPSSASKPVTAGEIILSFLSGLCTLISSENEFDTDKLVATLVQHGFMDLYRTRIIEERVLDRFEGGLQASICEPLLILPPTIAGRFKFVHQGLEGVDFTGTYIESHAGRLGKEGMLQLSGRESTETLKEFEMQNVATRQSEEARDRAQLRGFGIYGNKTVRGCDGKYLFLFLSG